MAGRTGLEPAAFRVTGGRYNQLNYHPAMSVFNGRRGSEYSDGALKLSIFERKNPFLFRGFGQILRIFRSIFNLDGDLGQHEHIFRKNFMFFLPSFERVLVQACDLVFDNLPCSLFLFGVCVLL